VKPLIGITCSWDEEKGRYFLPEAYAGAVTAGGGIPLLLAYNWDHSALKGITGTISGLILSGGVDVDPFHFGEDPISAGGEVTPLRDEFELMLAREALSSNMPVLGICRGMQVLNIAAGGDLYQDLSQLNTGAIKHVQQAPRWHPTHEIEVRAGTMLASITGVSRVRVNSFHHQALRKLAPGFTVAACSVDGIIEAVEAQNYLFAMGLQCHPECLWKSNRLFLSLFEKMVEAARLYRGVY